MLLTQVTLRRKVNGGDWTNVARAVYTYYGHGDPHGGEADLQTVTTQVWDGAQWQDTGTTLYRYYKQLPRSSVPRPVPRLPASGAAETRPRSIC